MTNTQYILCILGLSIIGIVLSHINSKIVLCPKNAKASKALDIGYLTMALVALGINFLELDMLYMKYGVLFFIASTNVYSANRTFNHYFEHAERKRHFCERTAYKKNLTRFLRHERIAGDS